MAVRVTAAEKFSTEDAASNPAVHTQEITVLVATAQAMARKISECQSVAGSETSSAPLPEAR